MFCMNCVVAQYCTEWTDEDEISLRDTVHNYIDTPETWKKKWEAISKCVGRRRSIRQCYQRSQDVYVIGYMSIVLEKIYRKFWNYAKQLHDLGYVVIDTNACSMAVKRRLGFFSEN